jgi:checkpoint serine/threonine-protein kinase
MKRGWMNKNWRHNKEPLQQISGNAAGDGQPAKLKVFKDEPLSEQPEQKLATDEQPSQSQQRVGSYEGKAGKARKFKVQGETQTSQYLSYPGCACVCVWKLTLVLQLK